MSANRNCRSFAAAASPFSLNQPRGKLKKKLMIKKLLLHSGTPPYGFLGNTVILPWQYGYFYSYHSSLNFFGGIFHYRILTPFVAAFLTCDQEGRLSSETIVHNRHCSVNRDQLLIVFISMTVCKHFVSLETRHAKNF